MPVTFNLEAAMNGAKLPYRWKPEYGARVGLLDAGSATPTRPSGASSTTSVTCTTRSTRTTTVTTS